MNSVIKVENLGKKYIIGHQKQRGGATLRDTMTHTARGIWQRVRHPLSPNLESIDLEELWALKDVNFEIQQGERLGIIGRNGAGKSTLLKVLSRITEPTTGKVRIKGRVSSLLEVGTGFHPELTGRENIFLNGAILGMSRQEIKKKFDEIVAFSELEKFLDTPVKRYSSGMYVRLAFAVAAHLEPEILIVDEVLSVGDAAFQKKCLGKMENVAGEGRTVLFVSHNMAAISNLCKKCMVLDNGKIVISGQTELVINNYLSRVSEFSSFSLRDQKDRKGNGQLRFTDVTVRDKNGKPLEAVFSGQHIVVSLDYTTDDNKPQKNVSVMIGFHSLLGQFLFLCGNEMVGKHFDVIPSKGRINCHIERFPLTPGIYGFNFNCSVNGVMADWIRDYIRISVNAGDFFGTGRLPPASHGGLLVDQTWRIE